MKTGSSLNGMKPAWRDMLIEHLDGGVPIVRDAGSGKRSQTRMLLVRRGWISEGAIGTRGIRPRLSYITHAGRAALAQCLGAWADELHRRAVLLDLLEVVEPQEEPMESDDSEVIGELTKT